MPRAKKQTHEEWEAEKLDQKNRIEVAVQLIRDGFSMNAAAKRLGIKRMWVYTRCRQLGVKQRWKEKEFYIYSLACPITEQHFYVGAAANPWTRYYAHLHSPASVLLEDWIVCLAAHGLKPLLKLLDHRCCEDWPIIEQRWIKKLAAEGHPLINQEVSAWEQNTFQ